MASKDVLALIPARGGSKSIPYKNIQLFAGHPLLSFSVAAALQSELVSRVIVSTDDERVAEAARQAGAEVPFLRPADIAQDTTLDLPVFQHALHWLAENERYQPEILVHLRPTSPIRPRGMVDAAIQVLLDHPEADSVRGVVPSGQNPHKMWRVQADGSMQPLLSVDGVEEPYNAPRQQLPATYWQTGHIDAVRVSTILDKASMSGDTRWPLFIDPHYTVDIDTQTDLRRAEWLVASGELDMVWPGKAPRPLPEDVRLLVLDFDGVITDDRVWVDENGREQVAANRGDGLGILLLKETGVEVLVLSKERNPVVAARCAKLGIACHQGVDDKAPALKAIMAERKLAPDQVVYLGNDVNDLPCFPLVGCAAVVANAHPQTLPQADLRLSKPGGHGAVRELCDLILAKYASKES
jgi:N-acylneuraminate cytidylyltransferase